MPNLCLLGRFWHGEESFHCYLYWKWWSYTLWVTVIRLGWHSLSSYFQSVVLEISLQSCIYREDSCKFHFLNCLLSVCMKVPVYQRLGRSGLLQRRSALLQFSLLSIVCCNSLLLACGDSESCLLFSVLLFVVKPQSCWNCKVYCINLLIHRESLLLWEGNLAYYCSLCCGSVNWCVIGTALVFYLRSFQFLHSLLLFKVLLWTNLIDLLLHSLSPFSQSCQQTT